MNLTNDSFTASRIPIINGSKQVYLFLADLDWETRVIGVIGRRRREAVHNYNRYVSFQVDGLQHPRHANQITVQEVPLQRGRVYIHNPNTGFVFPRKSRNAVLRGDRLYIVEYALGLNVMEYTATIAGSTAQATRGLHGFPQLSFEEHTIDNPILLDACIDHDNLAALALQKMARKK